MGKFWELINGKKTYLIAFIGAVFNLGVGLNWWAMGDQTWAAINAILVALGGMSLRAGVTSENAKGDGDVAKLPGGGATSVIPFWAILIISTSILSPMVAQAQTGETDSPEVTAYEAKELFEPDYTIGLITVKNNPGGEGIVTRITPGVGIGIAYSSVTSSDGEEWDVTVWSIAIDPLYIERDESGALFWCPGVKGTVFDEHLQVYLCYKVGSMTSDASRFEVKFGTNLVNIWDGLTEVAGL